MFLYHLKSELSLFFIFRQQCVKLLHECDSSFCSVVDHTKLSHDHLRLHIGRVVYTSIWINFQERILKTQNVKELPCVHRHKVTKSFLRDCRLFKRDSLMRIRFSLVTQCIHHRSFFRVFNISVKESECDKFFTQVPELPI